MNPRSALPRSASALLLAAVWMAAVWMAAVSLAACNRGPAVAGATSETTNGDLQASVFHADGSAAARVRVLVVDGEDWLGRIGEGRSPVLDSAYSDSLGRFTVKLPLGHRCNLQLDAVAPDTSTQAGAVDSATGTLPAGSDAGTGAEAAFRRDAGTLLADPAESRRFTLAAAGRVAGRLQSGPAEARALRLTGTAYVAEVEPDGGFAFPAVAAGSYAVIAVANRNGASRAIAAGTVEIAPGADLNGLDLVAASDRILVDDFALGWRQTALGRILGDGFWYTATDIGDKGNSSIRVDFVTDSASFDGSSVRAEYAVGTRLSTPWAIMGFNVGTSYNGDTYDFSDLTGISFLAKGSGIINVKFLSKAVSRLYQDSVHYYYPLRLPAEWTRITIPVDSLRMPANASAEVRTITWAQAAREMQTVDFTAEVPDSDPGDTVIFWADSIYLEGLSLDRLAPKAP